METSPTPMSTAAKDSGGSLPPVTLLAMVTCHPLRSKVSPTLVPLSSSSMTRSSMPTTPRFRAPSRTNSRVVTFLTAAPSCPTSPSVLAMARSPFPAPSSTSPPFQMVALLALVVSRAAARLARTSSVILP